MMVSITGTPCVGKTSVSREFEKEGWRYLDLKDLIIESGTGDEIIRGTGEILVDTVGLRGYLEDMGSHDGSPVIMDGHLSYLAPADICIVLRLNPEMLKERLERRGYSPEKILENVEAEGIGVILVEASEIEQERLGGRNWEELPAGCGILFELDATGLSAPEIFEKVSNMVDAYKEKRLNELLEYRPGKVDWLEEMVGWS
jgi:adenylate kinase